MLNGQPRRRVFFLDESMLTEAGFVPSIVTENEPGHTPCTFTWGHDYAIARKVADDSNAKLGHTPADVVQIIASSMGSAHWCYEHNRSICCFA